MLLFRDINDKNMRNQPLEIKYLVILKLDYIVNEKNSIKLIFLLLFYIYIIYIIWALMHYPILM